MLREGLKSVAAGMNPMDLKRGIDKAVKACVVQLAEISKPCSDHQEIAQVGTVSANADDSVGGIIAALMCLLHIAVLHLLVLGMSSDFHDSDRAYLTFGAGAFEVQARPLHCQAGEIAFAV